MKQRYFLTFVALLIACSGVHAQAVCPWLTQGTAAALLGAPVTVEVQIASSTQGTCDFTVKQAETTTVLEIAVASPELAICPAGSEHVVGIGDDTLACHIGTPQKSREVISSHVRSLKFSVSLFAKDPLSKKPGPTNPSRIVKQVAEQVAGNLF